ncbi:MAG: sugar-binding protein, partial [Bacteroidota bacterium]
MIKKFCSLVFLFSLLYSVSLRAGSFKKEAEAIRVSDPPVIDASLNDPAWDYLSPAGKFIQVSPYNGKPSRMKSEVKIIYNDEALYIGAMLHDPDPTSIVTHLSKRDEYSLSDYFGIYLDPFNDGLTSYGFFVTAAGVQSDMRSVSGSEDIEDENWDAVWESAVEITDEGWVVEIKIPYSALRFPDENNRKWGINFFRNIRRYRELSSWNHVNEEENSRNAQSGLLSGLENVKPPLRLSLNPYAATYINKYSAAENPGYSLKGGLDLKY